MAVATDGRSLLTAIRAVLKGFTLVTVFPVVLFVVSLLDVTYGILLMLLLLLAWGIAFVALGFLLRLVTFGHFSTPFDISGIATLAIVALAVDCVLIVSLIVISALIFVGGYTRLRRTIETTPRAVSRIVELSDQVAAQLGTVPFAQVFGHDRFYIGGFKANGKKVLVFDPRIADYLSDAELSALLMHEYAHFETGMSISYAFVRRCQTATRLFEFETNPKHNASFFYRAIWIVTWPLGTDDMKRHFRNLYCHIARVISGTYSFVTRVFTRLSAREFYDAEYFADSLAIGRIGPRPFAHALLTVFSLQLTVATKQETFEEYWKIWRSHFDFSTITHPSIRLRLARAKEDLDDHDYQRVIQPLWAGVVSERLTAGTMPSAVAPQGQFLQAFCLAQVDVDHLA